MLLCAGILGRYYTDTHDVDENERTISNQSGHWNTWGISEAAGMMCRELLYESIESYYVASSNIRDIHLLYGLA
jgi:hypothetical protein